MNNKEPMTEDKEILHKASEGKQCPYCLKEGEMIYIGCTPDGLNLNKCYDCPHCGGGWEGY